MFINVRVFFSVFLIFVTFFIFSYNFKFPEMRVFFFTGKRRCLGETLAKASLFLFFSTLMHNFAISLSPYEPMPSLEGYDGVTLSPKPFSVKLVPRK